MIIAVKKPGGRRSSKWPALRKRIIKRDKRCAVCGSTTKLEVHHILPYHTHPELELDELNLIVLCERKRSGLNCHLLMGHRGDYRSWNPTVRSDAAEWNRKLRERPR